ncbi:polymorphic toxin-type HINT domain-containing protein [Streptomyces sp. LN549]|uniref:polymorphic toxin-type HINT domain-containing protein n=1 Tax=Streptomyces sp. LN549 TaxID=3112979 RepID=UPI0037115440
MAALGNAYAYANNSPVTLSDPSGLCPADLCGIGTPYGDGSGRIIKDGPVDPGGPNRTTCHKGRCSDGLAVDDDNGGRGHIGNTTQNVQAEAAKAAQEVKTASAVAAAAKKQREGLTQKVISLVADVIGLTDAVNCFTKGDVMGCVNTALNAVPWGKIAKAIKAGWKAFKIWRALKKADKLVKEAEDLVRAAEASAKAASSQVKAMESAAAACTKHSFRGDTPVLLADGTTKPIADLRPGDEVTSTDPQTEVTAAEKVERHIVTKDDKEFTDLLLTPEPAASHAVGPVAAPAAGATTPRPVKLTTTWHHPFWDATHHRWTDARNLKPGTELHRPGGATVVVSAVRNYRASGVTYDLTVGVVHTYYVLAGATPVLVHNCAAGGRPKGLRPDPNAEGPHVTFRRDASTGKVNHYAEWAEQSNPRNPAPWEMVKRVDMQGLAHYDKATGEVIPTPHVNLPNGTARATEPWEETAR